MFRQSLWTAAYKPYKILQTSLPEQIMWIYFLLFGREGEATNKKLRVPSINRGKIQKKNIKNLENKTISWLQLSDMLSQHAESIKRNLTLSLL